jgi:hypothetical protein
MSFGFEVFDSSAQLILRVTDPALRVIFRRSIGATESGSASIPGYSAANARVYTIPKATEPTNTGCGVWLTQGTVNWAPDPNGASFQGRYRCPSEVIVVASS